MGESRFKLLKLKRVAYGDFDMLLITPAPKDEGHRKIKAKTVIMKQTSSKPGTEGGGEGGRQRLRQIDRQADLVVCVCVCVCVFYI